MSTNHNNDLDYYLDKVISNYEEFVYDECGKGLVDTGELALIAIK